MKWVGRFPSTAIWVEGHIGVGTPLGNLGLALDLQPMSYFALNMGVGESKDGTQWAIMPRLRVPFPRVHTAIGLGGGYSTGPYTYDNDNHGLFSEPNEYARYGTWNRAEWVSIELSAETYWMPFGGRYYVGYTALLDPHPSTCVTGYRSPCPDNSPLHSARILYVGAAFAFGAGL